MKQDIYPRSYPHPRRNYLRVFLCHSNFYLSLFTCLPNSFNWKSHGITIIKKNNLKQIDILHGSSQIFWHSCQTQFYSGEHLKNARMIYSPFQGTGQFDTTKPSCGRESQTIFRGGKKRAQKTISIKDSRFFMQPKIIIMIQLKYG